jgi:NAD(P)-dependent dehydrogenase (short-subunit alcohol dehydrogenase family)
MRTNDPSIKALVAGGGATGMPIIIRLLRSNATVIVPGKSLDELLTVKNAAASIAQGVLVTLLMDMPNYYQADEMLEHIETLYGDIDLMVMVFENDLPDNPLMEITYEVWEKMLLENVSTAFIGGRVMLSSMRRNGHGVYITLTHSMVHGPGLSPLANIAWNAQTELSRIFAAELKASGVRYYHVFTNVFKVDSDAQHIASLVLDLYVGHVANPENVFHVVSNDHTIIRECNEKKS